MGWMNDKEDSHVMVLEDSIQCGGNSSCKSLSMGLFQYTCGFLGTLRAYMYGTNQHGILQGVGM